MRHTLRLLIIAALLLTPDSALFAGTRGIKDMRDRTVQVPMSPQRVVTIDDGFVEGVMTHLGVIKLVAGIGSWSMKRNYSYTFTTIFGESYTHSGLNTMKFLHPWLDDLPCINSPQGNILNFETLASVQPDLVILRIGDCTVGAGNKEAADKTIATIESLGIPLIVLYAPTCFDGASLASMKKEMTIIGDIFENREKAIQLADMLAATENFIRQRTTTVPAEEKARVLYLGLNPAVRDKGGSGQVWGTDSPESYLIENVAGAINAYTGRGKGVPVSAEQLYTLDPDVIVLPTANGYHPPRELYEAPYYAKLAELRAVKNRRVYAMPWTPMNCARRLEYPLDMLIIAKAAYPDLFKDVRVHAYAVQLYRKLYTIDEATAKGLASTQLLDWMLKNDF